MLRATAIVYLLVIGYLGFHNVSECAKFPDLLQWCNDDILGWKSFNSTTSICFSCPNQTKLFLNRAETEDKVCCNKDQSVGVISRRTECDSWPDFGTESCDNGNNYISSEQCDGRNDCGDGSDERNCSGECTKDFRCTVEAEQCFPLYKVCDNKKDCRSGTDEMNCLYYNGRCKGFLCNVFQQCFAVRSVCNGRKDCIDGSDETGCNLTNMPTDFYCNNTATIPIELICNGNVDCVNGIDEENCYTWSPWGNWLCNCRTPTNATRLRTRLCIKFNNVSSPIDSNECDEGRATEQSSCTCNELTTEPPVLETRWIVIITLSSVIFLLLVIGAMFAVRHNKRLKLNGREIHITNNQEEMQGESVHEQPYRLGNTPMGSTLSQTIENSPRSVTTMPLPEPPSMIGRESHLYASIKLSTIRAPPTTNGNYSTTQIARTDEDGYDHVRRSQDNETSYATLTGISTLPSNGDNLSVYSDGETIVDPYRIERTPSESQEKSGKNEEEKDEQTIEVFTDPYSMKEIILSSPSTISLNEQHFSSSDSWTTIANNTKTHQRRHSQPIMKIWQ